MLVVAIYNVSKYKPVSSNCKVSMVERSNCKVSMVERKIMLWSSFLIKLCTRMMDKPRLLLDVNYLSFNISNAGINQFPPTLWYQFISLGILMQFIFSRHKHTIWDKRTWMIMDDGTENLAEMWMEIDIILPFSNWFVLFSGCYIIRNDVVWKSIREAHNGVLSFHGSCCFSHIARPITAFWQDCGNWQKTCIE